MRRLQLFLVSGLLVSTAALAVASVATAGDARIAVAPSASDAQGLRGFGSVTSAGFVDNYGFFSPDSHSCFISDGKGLACWGSLNFGQLGTGTVSSGTCVGGSCFAPYPNLADKVTRDRLQVGRAVAAAGSHTCMITREQGVACWGSDISGESGDETNLDGSKDAQPAPHYFPIGSDLHDITGLALGDQFSCAWRYMDAAYCWGNNDNGQLGSLTPEDGSDSFEATPREVFETTDPDVKIGGVISMTAGWTHACAVVQQSSRSVWCWGSNMTGELGDGSTDGTALPTMVSSAGGGSLGATQVAAGNNFTCALVGTKVLCWGLNSFGQLGRLSLGQLEGSPGALDSPYETTPQPVVDDSGAGQLTGVGQITAGSDFACALAEDGSKVRCWGRGDKGRLGRDEKTWSSRPLTVMTAASGQKIEEISAGGDHACARLSNASGSLDQVRCWGAGSQGQLGNGTFGEDIYSSAPVPTTLSSAMPLSPIATSWGSDTTWFKPASVGSSGPYANFLAGEGTLTCKLTSIADKATSTDCAAERLTSDKYGWRVKLPQVGSPALAWSVGFRLSVVVTRDGQTTAAVARDFPMDQTAPTFHTSLAKITTTATTAGKAVKKRVTAPSLVFCGAGGDPTPGKTGDYGLQVDPYLTAGDAKIVEVSVIHSATVPTASPAAAKYSAVDPIVSRRVLTLNVPPDVTKLADLWIAFRDQAGNSTSYFPIGTASCKAVVDTGFAVEEDSTKYVARGAFG